MNGCDDYTVLNWMMDDEMRMRIRKALQIPGERLRNVDYQDWRDWYSRERAADGRACRLEHWLVGIITRAVWHE